ncbi:MAG TPA: YdcF family protein [Bryobacteraceae bacterium]|nr:YdcF family protein [Bryobacteraceae bacterium]
MLPIPARFLVVRDSLSRSDLIYLLNGDPNLRPFYAAKLYQQDLAPLVIIARAGDSPMVKLGLYPNTTDMCIAVLKRLGVPQASIVELKTPNGVASTFDEAQALRNYVREHHTRHVIVVTSAFHTRRARWILRRVLRGEPVRVSMAPIDDPKYSASNWWTREDGQVACQDEYVKLFWYFLRYGF